MSAATWNATMDQGAAYDREVEAIRAANQPLLAQFLAWLKQAGLSAPTIITHVENIELFASYLVYYDPLKRLDEADSGDVWMFLADWFPRKALWASERSVKAYLATFKKFFTWMGETGHVAPDTVTTVLEMLKEGRAMFLRTVAEE